MPAIKQAAIIQTAWRITVGNQQTSQPNAEQVEFWNSDTGMRWVERNTQMDQMLRPVSAALIAAAAPQAGEHAVDIGCGCGNQTVLMAQALGSTGSVTGVDISQPMLEHARRHIPLEKENRLADIDYLLADASNVDLPANNFDLVFSRFGVMFFEQPVETFRHLASLLKESGRLTFSCWQYPKENEWVSRPMATVLEHVPAPEPPPPGTPGPFAFADPKYVETILTEAGFEGIKIDPLNLTLSVGPALTLEESVEFLMEMGPSARLIKETGEEEKEAIRQSLVKALKDYYKDGALQMKGAIWLVQATKAAQ
jgi:SAM-dependent methyltransferase